MKKLTIAVIICAVLTMAVGPNPRYLEELRIGGGYSDPGNGGADIDASGNVTTDGDVRCGELAAWDGKVSAGQDAVTRGMFTAFRGPSNAPGCLKLWSTSGVPYYVFASDDGTGLRISGILPGSNGDGQWLRAQTVADLSAPPAIGGAAPNSGRFTSATAEGELRAGGPAVIGATADEPKAKLHVYGGDSGFSGTRDARDADGVLVESDGDTLLILQGDSSGTSNIWFGDGQRERSGWLAYNHSSDVFELGTDGVARLTVSETGNLELNGDYTCKGGDATAGVAGSQRGIFTAASGGGGNTPGVIRLYSSNGTVHCLFVEDDGTLKVHSSLPAGNNDGVEVGAQYRSTITTFPTDDTTPSVSGGRLFKVSSLWSAGHNITAFDNGTIGQEILILGNDTDCTVIDGGCLRLSGDWTAAPGKTLSLFFDGANWYETARGNN